MKITKEILEDLHYNKFFNQTKIAKIFGVKSYHISLLFKKFGIKLLKVKDIIAIKGIKKCSKCKKEKILDNFSKNKERCDGFDKLCKVCASEHSLEIRNKNKIKNCGGIDENKTKECAECGKLKRIVEFEKCISKTDGTTSYCKECGLKKNREMYHKNKEKDEEVRLEKYNSGGKEVCCSCGIEKNFIEFYRRSGSGSKVVKSECKECEAKKKQTYYKDNKEYIDTRNREWLKENPEYRRKQDRKRRDLEHSFDFEYDEVCEKITKEIFENKCFVCGKDTELEIDHHYPLSKGNGLKISNAVILCKSCNCSKHDKDPKEFYTEQQLEEIEKLFKLAKEKYNQLKA